MDLELAKKLKELNEKKKDLNNELKNINEEIEKAEHELIEEMLNNEIQNFTYDGTMFYITTKVYANPEPTTKDTLFKKLKEYGYENLVYETVNSNTFSAFVREQMDENDKELPEWLNGLVNICEKTIIGMRRH